MKRWQSSGEIAYILERLRALDDSAVEGGKSGQFLETEKTLEATRTELRLNGNPAGLVHFARLILDVAAKGFEGAHVHLDGSGNLDRCDFSVVVSLKAADWDLD